MTAAGDWCCYFNPETCHSVVLHHSGQPQIGKKYVMSNAAQLIKVPKSDMSVPLSDLYRGTFNTCDIFNKQIHGRSWPHKKGGYNRFGSRGVEYNFILTCILINCFNLYGELMGEGFVERDFKTNCLELADELFRYANYLYFSDNPQNNRI